MISGLALRVSSAVHTKGRPFKSVSWLCCIKSTFWHLLDLCRFIKNLFCITCWETFMGQTPICQKPVSENFDEPVLQVCLFAFFASRFWCNQCFVPKIEVSELKWSRKKAPFALSNGISLAYWDLCSWKGHALTPRLNTCYILICCCLAFRIFDEFYCRVLPEMRWCFAYNDIFPQNKTDEYFLWASPYYTNVQQDF